MAKRYYTDFVEHCFRMAVRYDKLKDQNNENGKKWFKFTKAWIELQPEADRDLIKFVFSKQFHTTEEGVANYDKNMSMTDKWKRLNTINNRFAYDGQLKG